MITDPATPAPPALTRPAATPNTQVRSLPIDYAMTLPRTPAELAVGDVVRSNHASHPAGPPVSRRIAPDATPPKQTSNPRAIQLHIGHRGALFQQPNGHVGRAEGVDTVD
jgi:hypothetical protein